VVFNSPLDRQYTDLLGNESFEAINCTDTDNQTDNNQDHKTYREISIMQTNKLAVTRKRCICENCYRST